MKMPKQLEACEGLIRSWTTEYPKFYGVKVTTDFVETLFEAETFLINDNGSPDITHCRVLAAYHGPKGAKVPLSTSTTSGCVRPAFVSRNPWLMPNTPSCYDGGCYLFHARAIPAKKDNEFKVRAHITPAEGLLAAAQLGRHFSLPIRDNQSSDGSMSMALHTGCEQRSQLFANLHLLNESGFTDVAYLCFSSAYVSVSDDVLNDLGKFPNLIVHITVSGWHSTNENSLRLAEFERYATYLPKVFLRVVNRKDWAGFGPLAIDSGARSEAWLLKEIQNRGLVKNVIRTPFHSIHPFPGSQTGSLGSRHMSNYDYLSDWSKLLNEAKGECCTTGKCKSCPTRCGNDVSPESRRNTMVAVRALVAMLKWEKDRQRNAGSDPLGCYTARMLARKAYEQAQEGGAEDLTLAMQEEYSIWDTRCARLSLTKLQRRRLANDSHALVVDGLDRHGLWKMQYGKGHCEK